jgi:multicomponent Na+:H+ antiporter subunit E
MQLGTITSILRPLPVQSRQVEAVRVRKVSRLQQTFPLTVALFALWVILSGKFDAFHLLAGAASAYSISLGTRRLLLLPPAIGPDSVHPVFAIPWLRLLTYIPWLGWQIVLSSFQVAAVVLHPRMPIHPRLVRFQTSLPHTLARLTLANSITLTPGTVTLDVQDGAFLVHALTEASADGLLPKNGGPSMLQRVAALYPASKPSSTTGVTV